MADKPDNRGPYRISDILAGILKDRGWHSIVREHRVFDEWDESVGEIIARNAHPIRINRGVLLVVVSSPVWTQELSLMKETIIGRLNDRLKESIVRDIRFIQGEITDE